MPQSLLFRTVSERFGTFQATAHSVMNKPKNEAAHAIIRKIFIKVKDIFSPPFIFRLHYITKKQKIKAVSNA